MPTYPLVVAGEEVSCGNSRGENVHLLVAGHTDYIPGLGDSGRNWFQNKPDLSIGDVLRRVDAIPCFAAHPQYPIRWLERKIFRRGVYQVEDLFLDGPNPIAGLEFWNGSLDAGFRAGRQFWISQITKGVRLLPIGGNDAHGDLNRYTGVKTPLFSLFSSRSRLFGKVRTVVNNEFQSPLSVSSLHEAFRQAQNSGQLYITNGPALQLTLSDSNIHFEVNSSPDFGSIDEVTLFWGDLTHQIEYSETLCPEHIQYQNDRILRSDCGYIRAECRTSLGNFALSAPVWYSLS